MNFEIITSQLILPEMIEKTCKEAGWMDDWSVAQIFDIEQALASGREKSSTKSLWVRIIHEEATLRYEIYRNNQISQSSKEFVL